MKIGTFATVLLLWANLYGSNGKATPCEPENCETPDCRCSSTNIPDDLDPKTIPQIVHLTFNEGMTFYSQMYFEQLFYGQYKNPNGCNYRATHFVTHPNTDYTLVNDWWVEGHEIASFSVTQKNNITYWANINSTAWYNEMHGMKTILNNLGDIPEDDVKGMRCPDLQNGGDFQFGMMNRGGFLYDASLPTKAFGYTNMANALWPYSLDYLTIQDCEIDPCVESSFPGVWEYPILTLEDSRDIWGNGIGEPCSFLGACLGYPNAEPHYIFEMIKKNFDRAYNGNRAPFGLHAQVAYFVGAQEWMFDGYKMFLDYISSLPDVYVVPIIDGLEWVRNPKTLDELSSFEPFQCDQFPKPTTCRKSTCIYGDSQLPDVLQGTGERYVQVCGSCPPRYPWLNNPNGEDVDYFDDY